VRVIFLTHGLEARVAAQWTERRLVLQALEIGARGVGRAAPKRSVESCGGRVRFALKRPDAGGIVFQPKRDRSSPVSLGNGRVRAAENRVGLIVPTDRPERNGNDRRALQEAGSDNLTSAKPQEAGRTVVGCYQLVGAAGVQH